MKIALGQIDCEPSKIAANTRKLCDHVHRAARQDCDVVVFPEMADTGYDPGILASSAVPWRAGPLPALMTASTEAGIFIVCGLSERVKGTIYNALAVISPSGELIGRYRKIHLITPPPFTEDRCFTPGCDLLLSYIGGWRWGFPSATTFVSLNFIVHWPFLVRRYWSTAQPFQRAGPRTGTC